MENSKFILLQFLSVEKDVRYHEQRKLRLLERARWT